MQDDEASRFYKNTGWGMLENVEYATFPADFPRYPADYPNGPDGYVYAGKLDFSPRGPPKPRDSRKRRWADVHRELPKLQTDDAAYGPQHLVGVRPDYRRILLTRGPPPDPLPPPPPDPIDVLLFSIPMVRR
eukprot:3663282-Prorocentrum_lima.AAC.1